MGDGIEEENMISPPFNSGSIDVEEMTKIVGSLYEMEGLAKVS